MAARIGKYEVQSELGRGAFGRVYRAYDPVTRRNVAIKVLITENDPDILARFFLEVQATAKLKHKNIVTIFDFNENPPYIVMELVEGESLQQVIARHAPLSLLQKVRILSQAAEGLANAHENGIVHRDIKPANIMVLPNGDVKIMDFGIARVSGETEVRRTRQGDLIGTILYMSPERIQGTEADACSDVFSFGVVGYELITGRHPFEGKDYASVIYKVTSQEANPLRSIVPDCPEALEIIIQHAIEKDREVRSQSIEEVLFELKPVALELEHQQAEFLMREVQGLVDAQQFAEAQEKIRDVLELDPSNREARQVHDSLQKNQRRRLVRAKVETLVQEGTTQLESRQFNKAIQCFESAMRLDSDTQVVALLERARAALEASRQASRLLSEARREMLAGNLDAAYENALQAQKTDPQHHDAVGLCDKLRQQVEQRNQEIRIERALQRAEELVSQRNFEGARAVVAGFGGELPDALREMGLRIDLEEAEQVRRENEQHIQIGIAKATQQMHSNLLEDAEETLRALLEKFPEATAARKLLAVVEERAESQRRAEAVGKVARDAFSLLQAQNFAEARRMLESTLQLYPAEAILLRLLDTALELQKGYERAQSIAQILRQSQELRSAGKIEDALARIGQALTEYGPDSALTDLKRHLEFEHEQQIYSTGLRTALGNGRRLLGEEKFGEAVAVLEQAAAQYLGEPEIASLLASARHAQAEQQEQLQVAQTRARVEEFESRQEWQDGLDCAEAALRLYPYNATLSELAVRSRENWRQFQRQKNVARRKAAIEQALDVGNVTRASSELRSAREDFPEESSFHAIEERLQQSRAEAQLAFLEQEVDHSLAIGNLDRAAQLLTAAQGRADHPRWQALQRELLRRQGYRLALERAQQLKDKGELEAAEQLLRPLLPDRLPDNQAAMLLDAIATERRRLEHERMYRQTLLEAERLRALGDFNRAQQVLQETVHEALDRRAEDLLKTVIAERGQMERLQLLAQGKAEIRAWLERDDVASALAEIEKLTRDFPEDGELAGLRKAAERRQGTIQALAKIKDLDERRQFDASLGVAETALQLDPENSELIRILRRLREAAIGQLVESVTSCFAKNDLRSADTALEGAKERWSQEPRWQSLRRELKDKLARETELRQAERAREQVEQAIRDGRHQADTLKGKGDLKGALELLEGLIRQHPDHAGLTQDHRSVLRVIEIDFVNQALARITALQQQQKWDAALEEAEQAVTRYPENTALASAVREERDRKERTLSIREIDNAIARCDWRTAEQALQRAQSRFPLEKAFQRLQEDLAKGRRQEELSDLTTSVQHALLEGNLDEAARLIAAKRALSDEQEWRKLEEQLEFHRAYSRTLAEAENLQVEGKYERAEALLRQRLSGAPDTRAAALLRVVAAQRIEKEREATLARTRQEVERLAKEGKLQEALGLLDRACREYPEDFWLTDQRKDLERRAEEQRQQVRLLEMERQRSADRARKVASCRAAADTAIAAGDWEQAVAIVDRAELEIQGEPALAELRQYVMRRKQQAVLEEIANAVSQSFARRDLDEAARQLAATRSDFSEEALWQGLEKELARLQQYDRLFAEAQELIIAARYDAAQRVLREAISLDPADGRADALLEDIADRKNVKLRLKVQFRLIVKKHRRAFKISLSIVAGIVLASLLGWWSVSRITPPPPAITLRYQPAQLQLSYKVGTPEIPRGAIEFQPAPVDFQVSTEDDWLTVTPKQGNQLGRLEITVGKVPNVGNYTATVVVRTPGRSVTNAPVLIPVHLEVVGAERAKPVPLKLEKDRVDFTYTLTEAIPGPQEVRVIQGDVRDATGSPDWVLATHTIKSIRIALSPQQLPRLPAGEDSGLVTIDSADPRVERATLIVHLTVRPAPIPPPPIKEEKKLPPPPPPPPPPRLEFGPGCTTGPWGGEKDSSFTWVGSLAPNETVEIRGGAVSAGPGAIRSGMPPPSTRVLNVLNVDAPGIVVEQRPTTDNKCLPLKLKNTSPTPALRFTLHWQLVEPR